MPTVFPSLAETTAYWPHTTAEQCQGNGREVGVDLFDSPYNAGFVVIYNRFANGLRWPARSIDMNDASGPEILAAWTGRGTANDYRGQLARA